MAFAPLSMFNGLFLPYPTMALMSVYLVGRNFYNQGYVEKEGVKNNQRMAGAVMCHSATIFTMFISLFIGIQLSRGKISSLMRHAAFIAK